jgi:hypothetical protein
MVLAFLPSLKEWIRVVAQQQVAAPTDAAEESTPKVAGTDIYPLAGTRTEVLKPQIMREGYSAWRCCGAEQDFMKRRTKASSSDEQAATYLMHSAKPGQDKHVNEATGNDMLAISFYECSLSQLRHQPPASLVDDELTPILPNLRSPLAPNPSPVAGQQMPRDANAQKQQTMQKMHRFRGKVRGVDGASCIVYSV